MSSLYSDNETDAKARYQEYKSLDLFPEINPALLNSGDIIKYVSKVAMVYPFYEEDLKPASYALRLKGMCIYWNKEGKKIEQNVEYGNEFILESDSIAFVTLEPTIQLPYYIAARFNLKINHVYKGLLVGTGPLVDPGFVGRLSLPLHNLTTNDYIFKGGEKLIWMEFTKISKHHQWLETEPIDEKYKKNSNLLSVV